VAWTRHRPQRGWTDVSDELGSDAYAVVDADNALAESALVQELELYASYVVRPYALAATGQNWDEEQTALVDQACGNRVAGELGTADRDVRFRRLLERSDRGSST
jgi:hypothetical protein